MLKTSADRNWFVSTDWLAENIDNPSVKIIDGTWTIPGSENSLPHGIIPGSQFIDLGIWKSQTNLGAPFHPSDLIAENLSNCGINADNHIIVYDKQSYFSAPRIAWSLKGVGHEKVSVLRGGLPAWILEKRDVTTAYQKAESNTDYVTKDSLVSAVTIDGILDAIGTETQIIDARPAERFNGHAKEPRPGLRPGHIPHSINLPLGSLKNNQGQLLDKPSLKKAIKDAGIDLSKPIITTCGSGVTAAALAWLFYDIGKYDVAVYSGSWAEYGASNHPVEVT